MTYFFTVAGWAAWAAIIAIPIYDTVTARQSKKWKIGWVVVVLGLPFIGTVLYLVSDKRKSK